MKSILQYNVLVFFVEIQIILCQKLHIEIFLVASRELQRVHEFLENVNFVKKRENIDVLK